MKENISFSQCYHHKYELSTKLTRLCIRAQRAKKKQKTKKSWFCDKAFLTHELNGRTNILNINNLDLTHRNEGTRQLPFKHRWSDQIRWPGDKTATWLHSNNGKGTKRQTMSSYRRARHFYSERSVSTAISHPRRSSPHNGSSRRGQTSAASANPSLRSVPTSILSSIVGC